MRIENARFFCTTKLEFNPTDYILNQVRWIHLIESFKTLFLKIVKEISNDNLNRKILKKLNMVNIYIYTLIFCTNYIWKYFSDMSFFILFIIYDIINWAMYYHFWYKNVLPYLFDFSRVISEICCNI